MSSIIFIRNLLISTVFIAAIQVSGQQVDWDKPPPPRPKDPRLELQPIFDGNGVVYDWKAYIVNPVTNEKQEIEVEDTERIYRVSDSSNENVWTISLQRYDQLDRLDPQPQGVRVCLKDVQHPAGTEKPHFEYDISGQVTVAMTIDCPTGLPPKSVYDAKSIGRSDYAMSFLPRNTDPKAIGSAKSIITPNDCSNCVYVENSAFTHPDRAGGPDVASNSDRTLFAFREIVNEIRLYQDPLDPSQGGPNGFAYAWQGSRTNPGVSILKNRHDPEGNYGVVFTIPKGYVYPNVEGTKNRTGGLTALLKGDERTKNKKILTPPPITQ